MHPIVAPSCHRQHNIYLEEDAEIEIMELYMLIRTKLNLVSGMIIGALAVLAIKQMCTRCKNHQQPSKPIGSSVEQSVS